MCETLSTVLQSVWQSSPLHFNTPLRHTPNLPDPKTLRSNGEHGGALQRKKTLEWTHEGQNVSPRARFKHVIREGLLITATSLCEYIPTAGEVESLGDREKVLRQQVT